MKALQKEHNFRDGPLLGLGTSHFQQGRIEERQTLVDFLQ
jgi:hypothetical protein